jgi:two-component system sensor histidine kinase TctE
MRFLRVEDSAELSALEATLDAVLGCAAQTLAEEMRSGEGKLVTDLSPGTFSMLAAMGQERIFYRIDVAGQTVSGYEDLPPPETLPAALAPGVYSVPFRDADFRVAAVVQALRIEGRSTLVLVLLGQTREGQRAIAALLGNRAEILGLGVFGAAIPLGLFLAYGLLRPIDRLAKAVGRRGVHDLRSVRHPAQAELLPFVTALSSLIRRLQGKLSQTETLIAVAAHHVRTPLALIRTKAKLALRHSGEEGTRTRLRGLIRSADDAARPTGQLLDHATVLSRVGQAEWAPVDPAHLTRKVATRLEPAAGIKDITLRLGIAGAVPAFGDAVLIEAALRKILDNAIKYSEAETVVEVGARTDGAMAIITVADRG